MSDEVYEGRLFLVIVNRSWLNTVQRLFRLNMPHADIVSGFEKPHAVRL
jgi:hypothetical protein